MYLLPIYIFLIEQIFFCFEFGLQVTENGSKQVESSNVSRKEFYKQSSTDNISVRPQQTSSRLALNLPAGGETSVLQR